MTVSAASSADGAASLARLKEREEVLEICYWYEGEGLGPRLSAEAVLPFMASDPSLVREVFGLLVGDGDLEPHAEGGFAFTEAGRKKAARLFADTFTEYQLGGHGECTAGCCDEEGAACEDGHAHGHGQGGHGHGHAHGFGHAHDHGHAHDDSHGHAQGYALDHGHAHDHGHGEHGHGHSGRR
jgi:hypothetical protein